MAKGHRATRSIALITLSAVFALGGFLFVDNWDAIASFPWRLNAGYLTLAIIFHSLALGMTFVAWRAMVVRLSGFGNVLANFRIYYVSTLAKRIPVSIWYIGGRLVMYKELGVSRSSILNGILLENVTIGLVSVLTFLVLLPFYSVVPEGVTVPIAVVGLASVVPLLARPQMFIELTNRVLRRLGKRELDRMPRRSDILKWGGYYGLTIAFSGMSLYAVTRTFIDGAAPGWIDSTGIAALTTMVALLSMILPGGFGLKELTAGVLLSRWIPLPTALIISVMYRLIQTANEVLWALGASLIRPPSKMTIDGPSQYEGVIDD